MGRASASSKLPAERATDDGSEEHETNDDPDAHEDVEAHEDVVDVEATEAATLGGLLETNEGMEEWVDCEAASDIARTGGGARPKGAVARGLRGRAALEPK